MVVRLGDGCRRFVHANSVDDGKYDAMGSSRVRLASGIRKQICVNIPIHGHLEGAVPSDVF